MISPLSREGNISRCKLKAPRPRTDEGIIHLIGFHLTGFHLTETISIYSRLQYHSSEKVGSKSRLKHIELKQHITVTMPLRVSTLSSHFSLKFHFTRLENTDRQICCLYSWYHLSVILTKAIQWSIFPRCSQLIADYNSLGSFPSQKPACYIEKITKSATYSANQRFHMQIPHVILFMLDWFWIPRQINIHTDMWRKIHDFINTIWERWLPVRLECPMEFEI